MTKTSDPKPLGIYLHIPFCIRRCRYCAFFSQALCSMDEPERDRAMRLETEEILEKIRAAGKKYGEGHRVDTVFIGGGTPTVLPDGMIRRILDEIRRSFDVEKNAEVTSESNPGTITEAKLSELREAGVNRLSIGVQSLDDSVLQTLGRIHSADEARDAVGAAKNAGFDSVSCDLMFAVPGQTMRSWKETLEGILALGPEHLSFYSLQIEEGTPFYDLYKKGDLALLDDEEDRRMYHEALRILREAGYRRYEISSACVPGFECRHNLKYWSLEEYLGIGKSASSFIGGVRMTEEPFPEYHVNDRMDNAGEFMFTGLRRAEGITFREFREKIGASFEEVYGDRLPELEEFFREGELIRTEEGLYLSERGIDISNRIFEVFL